MRGTIQTLIGLLVLAVVTGCDRAERVQNQNTMTDSSVTTLKGKGSYAEINGLKMYYEVHGEGFPLVLIHGGGSTIETTWGRVLGKFANHHKVIAVEMQAHGRTGDRDRELSFENDADDISALLRFLQVPRADVFGFSNGASTTLQMAIRHPEQVNRIVVASTFYRSEGAQPWFSGAMAKATFEGMPQAFKDGFLAVNNNSAALRRMYERDVYRMQHFAGLTESQVRSITAPAFIISGTEDVNTIEHAVEMHRLLKNSSLAVLPGGHGDYIGEITRPLDTTLIEATVSMVNKFLDAGREK
jgi:pimeloyl-ACP methyl ester carboxylesterase